MSNDPRVACSSARLSRKRFSQLNDRSRFAHTFLLFRSASRSFLPRPVAVTRRLAHRTAATPLEPAIQKGSRKELAPDCRLFHVTLDRYCIVTVRSGSSALSAIELRRKPIATASRARPAGRARDHRPTAASHAAPRPQPTVKPTIGGQVCFARRRALGHLVRIAPE